MSRALAAIIGGAAGGLALLVILIGFLRRFFCQRTASRNRNSDTGSSNPSTFVGSNGGVRISFAGVGPSSGNKGLRQFTLEELEAATKQFSESNLVGVGSFGLVYKGLLLDGTVVAIKRRQGSPRQEFVEEENSLQILVYEYLPNGSISSHLYDKKKDSITKLEFKQRLSVAIGAAKGLSYLHSLTPPIVHNGFKTSNVLVDENFITKVADVGIVNLLRRIEGVGPQTDVGQNFQDLEYDYSLNFENLEMLQYSDQSSEAEREIIERHNLRLIEGETRYRERNPEYPCSENIPLAEEEAIIDQEFPRAACKGQCPLLGHVHSHRSTSSSTVQSQRPHSTQPEVFTQKQEELRREQETNAASRRQLDEMYSEWREFQQWKYQQQSQSHQQQSQTSSHQQSTPQQQWTPQQYPLPSQYLPPSQNPPPS